MIWVDVEFEEDYAFVKATGKEVHSAGEESWVMFIWIFTMDASRSLLMEHY